MALLRDDVGEIGGEPFGFEDKVGVFRPRVVHSSSEIALSRDVELRRAGADKGGFSAAESTDSAYGKESVESVMWERWDKEADRGEIGGESVRGGERETLDVEKKEEIKLMVRMPSAGAVFGRRGRLLLAARSLSRRQ